MVGDIVLENAGAKRGPRALEEIQVLEQERHARERAVRQPLVDLPPGMVVVPDNDRVDRRIDFFRARDRFVQQLGRADLFVADQIGKAYAVILAVFPEGHLDPPAMPSREPVADPGSSPGRALARKRASRARRG
jgi:hypothetical protein